MVFCPLIAALALQGAADTSDVVVENRRPSSITAALVHGSGIAPKGCRVEALDAEGKIRLHGPGDQRKMVAECIRMFDVKPRTVTLSVLVESKLDKTDYRLQLEVPNMEEFDFTESTTGLKVGIQPRVNGDGSVTLSVSYGYAGETYRSVARIKQKGYYVFCSGPHGSCSWTGDAPKHPKMLDPVLVISPRVER